ncbi:MAG: 50S ribosomal protein L18 [Planctomycetota bacterium]
MDRQRLKNKRATRRRIGLRKRLAGTAERPRLAVNRTLKHISVQVIDDLEGVTLLSTSTMDKSLGLGGSTGNVEAAKAVGKRVAEIAKEKGITKVVFDRRGSRYHGRIKALADGAREGGLEF